MWRKRGRGKWGDGGRSLAGMDVMGGADEGVVERKKGCGGARSGRS